MMAEARIQSTNKNKNKINLNEYIGSIQAPCSPHSLQLPLLIPGDLHACSSYHQPSIRPPAAWPAAAHHLTSHHSSLIIHHYPAAAAAAGLLALPLPPRMQLTLLHDSGRGS